MAENKEYMTIKDDKGVEHKCAILFTYYLKEYDHHYVVFQVEDTNELSAMIYVEQGDNEGTLHPIENDKEWDELEKVVADFLDEQEHHHGCNCDHCDGDCDCDHDHDCDCDNCDHDCDCHHE